MNIYKDVIFCQLKNHVGRSNAVRSVEYKRNVCRLVVLKISNYSYYMAMTGR